MSTFLSFLGLLCLAQVTLKALPPFDSVLFGKIAKSTNDSADSILLCFFCHFFQFSFVW